MANKRLFDMGGAMTWHEPGTHAPPGPRPPRTISHGQGGWRYHAWWWCRGRGCGLGGQSKELGQGRGLMQGGCVRQGSWHLLHPPKLVIALQEGPTTPGPTARRAYAAGICRVREHKQDAVKMHRPGLDCAANGVCVCFSTHQLCTHLSQGG